MRMDGFAGNAKAEFVECARQWQELARQKREMEQEQRQDSLPYRSASAFGPNVR
jgi:hypothetical protein